MTNSRIWRFSLLAAALPWLAVPACGGRTGDYDLPGADFIPSNGGSGAQTPAGAGATPIGSSDTDRGGAKAPVSSTTSNPVGPPSRPPATGTVGRGGSIGSSPGGGVILPPPPIGAGGSVFPPFGTGGFIGTAGASFGGTGGITQCSAPGSRVAEVCVPPTLPITQCCTSQGRCGLQLFPDSMIATNIPLAGGCQPMDQPGYPYLGCPDLAALVGQPEANVTLSACCRYDGTCGLDLTSIGVGCVQSTKGGKPIRCGPIDAGVIDGSTPPVDAGGD